MKLMFFSRVPFAHKPRFYGPPHTHSHWFSRTYVTDIWVAICGRFFKVTLPKSAVTIHSCLNGTLALIL